MLSSCYNYKYAVGIKLFSSADYLNIFYYVLLKNLWHGLSVAANNLSGEAEEDVHLSLADLIRQAMDPHVTQVTIWKPVIVGYKCSKCKNQEYLK